MPLAEVPIGRSRSPSHATCTRPCLSAPHPACPLTHLAPQARERGLTKPGDRVVVSQCPRANQRFSESMQETGVVKIMTLGADGVSTIRSAAVLNSAGHVVGSVEEDEDLV